MTRFAFLAAIAILIVLLSLGVLFLKDSYKVLPIDASKEFSSGPFDDWRKFTAPSGKFDVMFPGLPQHATQTVKDKKTDTKRYYDMYVAEKPDGSIFMVSLITFPDGKETPEFIQKTVVNDLLASNPANQLKNMKIGSYKTYKTLDFSIANNDMTIDGMTFVDGNTLYVLSAVFRNAFYNAADFDYFLKTFELSKPKVEESKK